MNRKTLILKIPSVSCSDSINPMDIIVDDSDQHKDHEMNNLHNNVDFNNMNVEINDVLDNIEENVNKVEGNVSFMFEVCLYLYIKLYENNF